MAAPRASERAVAGGRDAAEREQALRGEQQPDGRDERCCPSGSRDEGEPVHAGSLNRPGAAAISRRGRSCLIPADDLDSCTRCGTGRRAQSIDRAAPGALSSSVVTVPFFSGADVERAVSPHDAYDAVKAAFIAHAQGTWTMQPKVYVSGSEHGDFRAMPALGDGHAVLKWVTSFPGNPPKGLPTVTGLVLLSDTETGALLALMDAAAVTALRTAAAAVIAAETLCRSGAEIDRGDRLRRQRRRDGAHVPGARRRRPALGHRPCAGRVRRRSPRGNRRAVAAGGARERHRGHRHARPRAPLSRAARFATGSTSR